MSGEFPVFSSIEVTNCNLKTLEKGMWKKVFIFGKRSLIWKNTIRTSSLTRNHLETRVSRKKIPENELLRLRIMGKRDEANRKKYS